MDTVVAVIVGIGLAAACGLRVFVPLLVLCIASRAGVVPLAESMAWLGSTPALVALSCATVLEIAAYKVPWLDHALDTVASPAAVIGGTLIAASQLGVIDASALSHLTGTAGAASDAAPALAPTSGTAPAWLMHLLPLVKWGTAVLAGGGAAALTQTATVSTRATSTVATGGLLNPVIGVVQSVASVLVSVVIVLAPVIGAVLLIAGAYAAWRVVRRVRRRWRAQAA